ncbi:flagellar protein FliT [Lentibacillus saliphilus]|uniref:flagellar protein FliT n=1 Tax=Lentibacillus saliphilus TaxID=2737028 RepID=UPI001C310EF5|nr:flagellar protein FliT [Lentibacillus saliphilus]
MGDIKALLNVTEELADLFEQPVTSKDRSKIIVDINRLIEARGHIMEMIKPPFTEEEKQIGEQVVMLNNVIKYEMDQLFAELKTEMKQMKQLKRSNQSYTNPYQHVNTMDGMFMDSKK